MQALKLERDGFDRWIRWALASNREDAQPSEQVWRRIAHHVVLVEEVRDMLFNHYEAEQVLKERVRDAQHQAEQRRLARAVGNSRRTWGWGRSVALLLAGLLPVFKGRGVAGSDAGPLPSAAPAAACEGCLGS